MARVNKITGRAVKKKTPLKRISKRGLQAPGFEGWENLSGAKFHTLKQHNNSFWYMNYKHNENIEHCFTWMKQNGYDKETINNVKKATKYESLLGIYCRMLLDGCPDYNEKEQDYWQSCPGTGGDIKPLSEWIGKRIRHFNEIGKNIIEEKKVEDKEKKNVHIPTIQERIREQAYDACEDIEVWMDGFISDKENFDPKGFNFSRHFLKFKVSQAHARKIKGMYAGEYEEAQLIQKLPSPADIKKIKDEHEQDMARQLREAYEHLTKADAKRYLQALETLMGACDVVIDSAKSTRKPRIKKAPSKEKLVSKIKYCKKDDNLQLVSLNPLDLIDSKEVWVYNIKTRKLGKYIADDHVTISVKGTTLLHYNQMQSIQKTLRKPADTIKEFKKAGKVALRTFMEDIKTTDIKLNGRLNTDTIILKVTY
jgi:hypothetical protein